MNAGISRWLTNRRLTTTSASAKAWSVSAAGAGLAAVEDEVEAAVGLEVVVGQLGRLGDRLLHVQHRRAAVVVDVHQLDGVLRWRPCCGRRSPRRPRRRG
jgi:hypothetical protein